MKITVNEVGYILNAAKIAVSDHKSEFRVIDILKEESVPCQIRIKECGMQETAGEEAVQIDFTDLNKNGSFCIEAADGTRSPVFKIERHVYKTLKNALLKAFYFQR